MSSVNKNKRTKEVALLFQYFWLVVLLDLVGVRTGMKHSFQISMLLIHGSVEWRSGAPHWVSCRGLVTNNDDVSQCRCNLTGEQWAPGALMKGAGGRWCLLKGPPGPGLSSCPSWNPHSTKSSAFVTTRLASCAFTFTCFLFFFVKFIFKMWSEIQLSVWKKEQSATKSSGDRLGQWMMTHMKRVTEMSN